MERFSKRALASVCAVALAMLIHLGHAQNLPDDYLTPLNEARAAVGVGPMTWDDTVAAFAQSYANSRIGDCALEHSENPMYGETIFWGGGNSWSAGDAASTWVEEKQYYDYSSNTCSAPADDSCGHYTQVVWRNSTQLGCARVECANGDTFITCNYNPPGNVGDERPY